MADTAPKLLTVAEYLAITAELDDDMKWELIDGVMTPKASRVIVENGVTAMAPERGRHARVKFLAAMALERAVREAGAPCVVTVDGIGVAISERSSYIPDIIVDCGGFDPDAYMAKSPTIVVDVLSPSIRAKDCTKKLVGYFSVETLAHYLIVDPAERDLQHHRRTPRGIEYEISAAAGTLRLDPPGLTVDLAAFFD